MTVKELIAALQSYDESDLVIIAKDREGNAFSPLDQLTDDAYTAENTWSGTAKLRTLTTELRKEGYTEEDVAPVNSQPCVTLWPVH